MTGRALALAFALLLAPTAAHAFQSRTLECGFTYIAPAALIALVAGIVASVRTVMVLRASPPAPVRLWRWWLVPGAAIAAAILASYLC